MNTFERVQLLFYMHLTVIFLWACHGAMAHYFIDLHKAIRISEQRSAKAPVQQSPSVDHKIAGASMVKSAL
jgi:phospholipase C